MKIHELKIIKPYFMDVFTGDKRFEVRKNDRDFQIGDQLLLKEYWDNDYTGLETTVTITYILHGGQFGIEKDYVVMSIE